jgi:hypothetical protein
MRLLPVLARAEKDQRPPPRVPQKTGDISDEGPLLAFTVREKKVEKLPE